MLNYRHFWQRLYISHRQWATSHLNIYFYGNTFFFFLFLKNVKLFVNISVKVVYFFFRCGIKVGNGQPHVESQSHPRIIKGSDLSLGGGAIQGTETGVPVLRFLLGNFINWLIPLNCWYSSIFTKKHCTFVSAVRLPFTVLTHLGVFKPCHSFTNTGTKSFLHFTRQFGGGGAALMINWLVFIDE